MYLEGDSLGFIGLECMNATHFDGLESFCGPNGQVVDEPTVLSCDDSPSVPFCVQCGPRQWGAALCLSDPAVPEYCTNETLLETEPPALPPPSSGCLVGDIMYLEGDSLGFIGLECTNATHFDGLESFCGPNGQVVDEPTVLSCDDSPSVPFCVQCGPRQWGAALCLSDPAVPEYCTNVTLFETELPASPQPSSPTAEPPASPPPSSPMAAAAATSAGPTELWTEKATMTLSILLLSIWFSHI